MGVLECKCVCQGACVWETVQVPLGLGKGMYDSIVCKCGNLWLFMGLSICPVGVSVGVGVPTTMGPQGSCQRPLALPGVRSLGLGHRSWMGTHQRQPKPGAVGGII